MTTTEQLKQRTPEWHKARAGRVTASMAGALLGFAPYRSADDAFRDLVRSIHGLPSEFEGNIATDYGNNNEAGALVEYEMETGNTVQEVGFVTFSDWLGASPDGLIGNLKVLEIKCPFGLRKDDKPKFKGIHDQLHYYAQVQIQMFCTGRQECDFYQWAPKGSMLESVKYDDKYTRGIIKELIAIHVKAMAADPADYDGPKRPVIDTPEAHRLVDEYDDLAEMIDNATQRKKEVLAEIVRLANETDSTVAGRKLTLVERKGTVSYAKALKAYAPDADLEPFRGKSSSSWRLA